MKRGWWLVLLLVGCDRAPSTLQRVAGGASAKWAVTLTDYTSGLLTVLDAEGTALFTTPIHSDAVVRAHGGNFYVLNRFGADNLQVVGADGNLLRQQSVGRGTNPQDLVFLEDGSAVLSGLRLKSLMVWRDGELAPWQDLTPFADDDGYAEATGLHVEGGAVYAVLQRLNGPQGFVPTEYSLVGRWREGKALPPVQLHFTNPVTALKPFPGGGLAVGCAGRTGLVASLDGGIERVDGDSGTSRVVLTEAQLGGELVDFAFADETLGVAVVSRPHTALVAFNPSTATVLGEWVEAAGYVHQGVEWDSAGGGFWVLSRDPKSPGLELWSRSGQRGRTIPLALPPYHLTVVGR